MKKFDRAFFVKTGAVGGSAEGESKRRGGPDYYREIQRKSAESRKRNRLAKEKK